MQTYVEKQDFAGAFFHFSAKHTAKIAIDLAIDDKTYHVEFTQGSDDNLVFEQEFCTDTVASQPTFIKGKLGESGLIQRSDISAAASPVAISDYMAGCRIYHFHDTGPSAGFKQAVAPFFHDFHFTPKGQVGNQKLILKWTHRDHDDPFSANQLSDGSARFICLATRFLQPHTLKPNTIIIDEPELGLHPAALDVLADMVKSAAKASQVICSTQSVTFANQFEPENFIVVDQQAGASMFKRLEPKALEHWLEDYGMGDVWNKNLVGGRPPW